jgi:perosamine synthetase
MRIGRTLPPAAALISKYDLFQGLIGLIRGQNEIEHFKSNLKEYFQVKHCFLLSSGKAALSVILQALKQIFPYRNEVIIPAFTCYSVPSAIVRAGLKIRLCDVNPETLDFNFTEFQKITNTNDKLLGIVCPHLFGLPADIEKASSILANPQITIIEDAAQAMGMVVNNRKLGTLGDIGFFSLGRGKVLSTVNGGIIITNSKRIAEEIEIVVKENTAQLSVNHSKLMAYAVALSVFSNPSLFWLPKLMPGLKLGETIYNPQFPVRQLSPFQAGLARNWRKRITEFQAKRKQNVHYWSEVLIRFPWLQPVPIRKESIEETFPLLRFPVLVPNPSLRNNLLKISEKFGLGIMTTYPGSIDKINELKLESEVKFFPSAQECVDRLVTFPVHGLVAPKDRQRIVKCLELVKTVNLA